MSIVKPTENEVFVLVNIPLAAGFDKYDADSLRLMTKYYAAKEEDPPQELRSQDTLAAYRTHDRLKSTERAVALRRHRPVSFALATMVHLEDGTSLIERKRLRKRY